MKLTNIAAGPRGIFTTGGFVVVNPGETRDVELPEAEAKDLNKEWFATGKAAAKAAAETQGADSNSGSETTVEPANTGADSLAGGEADDVITRAIHRGGGSYSVMRGDEEIVERLTKEEAAQFNELDAAGQAQFIDGRK